MGASWKLEESRLIQLRQNSSAANADLLTLGSPGPPAGKIWIIVGLGYMPSVAETQVVSFQKYSGDMGVSFGLLNPISLNLNPGVATAIEQGMEYTLFPNEYIIIRRVTHTAGSTMGGYLQAIEIDQPLYTYEEPQVVNRQQRALSSIRTALAGGSARGSGGGERPGGGERGGGGRGIPI